MKSCSLQQVLPRLHLIKKTNFYSIVIIFLAWNTLGVSNAFAATPAPVPPPPDTLIIYSRPISATIQNSPSSIRIDYINRTYGLTQSEEVENDPTSRYFNPDIIVDRLNQEIHIVYEKQDASGILNVIYAHKHFGDAFFSYEMIAFPPLPPNANPFSSHRYAPKIILAHDPNTGVNQIYVTRSMRYRTCQQSFPPRSCTPYNYAMYIANRVNPQTWNIQLLIPYNPLMAITDNYAATYNYNNSSQSGELNIDFFNYPTGNFSRMIFPLPIGTILSSQVIANGIQFNFSSTPERTLYCEPKDSSGKCTLFDFTPNVPPLYLAAGEHASITTSTILNLISSSLIIGKSGTSPTLTYYWTMNTGPGTTILANTAIKTPHSTSLVNPSIDLDSAIVPVATITAETTNTTTFAQTSTLIFYSLDLSGKIQNSHLIDSCTTTITYACDRNSLKIQALN